MVVATRVKKSVPTSKLTASKAGVAKPKRGASVKDATKPVAESSVAVRIEACKS